MQYLEQQVSLLNKRKEDTPLKLRLLCDDIWDAAYDHYEEVEGLDETVFDNNRARQRFYGDIIHIAAMIGDHSLLELQIRTGADVEAVDDHSWTPLKIATAQGFNPCAKLILACAPMTTLESKASELFPDGLYTNVHAGIEIRQLSLSIGDLLPFMRL